MDEDVKKHLLWLLTNAPLEVPGSQLALVADLHARAVDQVQAAPAPSNDPA